MPYNSEGVYEYDDSEEYSPLKNYMNLGQDSITQAIAAVRAEIAALDLLLDSDWVPITTIATGWEPTAGHPPRVRKVGDHVDLFGALTWTGEGSGATTANMLTLPEGYVPAGEYVNQFIGAGTGSDGTSFTLFTSLSNPGRIMIPSGYVSKPLGKPEVIPLLGGWYVS